MSSRGTTLHNVIDAGKPLPPDQAFTLCADLARLLEGHHRANRVFGGIYPDQVQFEPDGLVEIFSLTASRTVDDLTLAYLCFVPPEILSGEPSTPQSDIYSVGSIIYTLLTGRVPFDTGSQEQLVSDIQHSLTKPLPPLAAHGNQADWIIKKCMNHNPRRRFATAQELSSELKKLVRTTRPLPGPAHIPVPSKQAPPSITNASEFFQRYGKFSMIAAVAVILIVAGLVYAFGRKSHTKIKKSSWSGRVIAETPELEKDPSLSPSGDAIAYVSNFSGNWEIYVRPVNGSSGVAITQSPGIEENPKWSPDGERILFTYRGPGVPSTLFTVAPSGGIPQKIADHARDGQWSPDGKLICYVTPAEEEVRSLIVLDWRESKTRTVVQSEKGLAHPSFSPEGNEIVTEVDIKNKHGLLLVDVESGEKKILTQDGYDFTPAWSWPTEQIFFSSRKDGDLKIWKTDRDGKVSKLTDGKGEDFRPSPAMNGASFLFFRENHFSEIQTLNPEDPVLKRESPLAEKSFYPRAVSRDSFVFFSERSNDLELLWGMPGSSVASTVTQSLPGNSAISVSPDGSYIYLERPAAAAKGLMQISLKDGTSVDLGSSILLPYEVSPDKKLLFYAVRQGNGVLYKLKDLKTQQDENLFMRPYQVRILRAFWLDNSRLVWRSADHVVSVWSIKENSIFPMLTSCHDFSLRPRSETIAALIGPTAEESAIFLADLKNGKRIQLLRFNPDVYSRNLDWSKDGRLIYYDRFQKESDLYIAE